MLFLASQLRFDSSVPVAERGDSGEKVYIRVMASGKSDQGNGVTDEDLEGLEISGGLEESLWKGHAGQEGDVYSRTGLNSLSEKGNIDRGWLEYAIEFESARDDFKYRIDFHLPFSTSPDKASNEKFIRGFSQTVAFFRFID